MRILFVLMVLISNQINAQEIWSDSFEMEKISIVGNKESPKALYISPWKTNDLQVKVSGSEKRLINQIIVPVERASFLRHLKYYTGKG